MKIIIKKGGIRRKIENNNDGNKNEYWLRVLVGKSGETKDKCKRSNSDEGDRKVEMKDTNNEMIPIFEFIEPTDQFLQNFLNF